MNASARAEATRVAEAYYDSNPADRFYFRIWGGEDIHIGIYEDAAEPIAAASRRTVLRIAGLLPQLDASTHVLDLGAGYGGAARQLARQFGCRVSCLNLSEVQNATNRRLNREQGLQNLIEVRHGDFEAVPLGDASVDVVWSQDAFLHSAHRDRVLQEAARVLRPGGHLVFTDPMQADDCPPGTLQAVLDRIHLESLGSFAFYRRTLGGLGFTEVGVHDLSPQLGCHYRRVRDELRGRYQEMCRLSTQDYVDRMLAGLDAWIEASAAGRLAWGILHFAKPG